MLADGVATPHNSMHPVSLDVDALQSAQSRCQSRSAPSFEHDIQHNLAAGVIFTQQSIVGVGCLLPHNIPKRCEFSHRHQCNPGSVL